MDVSEWGSVGALIVSASALFHSIKGTSRKESDERMRKIAVEVMNPDLQKERHETLEKSLEEIKVGLKEHTIAVERATLAGVQAGYRMVIKDRRRGEGD